MGLFGKSAQQKRIDSDAVVIADLRAKLKAVEAGKAQVGLALSEHQAALLRAEDSYRREAGRANRIAGRLADAHRALRDIKRMATPHCAHIGRKMAGRADEALPADMGGHPKPDATAQFKPTNGAAQHATN